MRGKPAFVGRRSVGDASVLSHGGNALFLQKGVWISDRAVPEGADGAPVRGNPWDLYGYAGMAPRLPQSHAGDEGPADNGKSGRDPYLSGWAGKGAWPGGHVGEIGEPDDWRYFEQQAHSGKAAEDIRRLRCEASGQAPCRGRGSLRDSGKSHGQCAGGLCTGRRGGALSAHLHGREQEPALSFRSKFRQSGAGFWAAELHHEEAGKSWPWHEAGEGRGG